MGERSLCTHESSKVCGRCGIEKPIDEFYKIVARDEKSERTDRVCKSCKGEIKKARKSRNTLETSIGNGHAASAIVRSSAFEQPSSLPVIQSSENPDATTKPSEELAEPIRKHKYTHPNYEDWEVRQAIEVFQLLQKKRDEARKKGLINW